MKKFDRPSIIFSDNPKLDTSGMVGKEVEWPMHAYEMPKMSTRDMVEAHCAKKGKGKGKGKGY